MYILDKDAVDQSIDVEILDSTSGTGEGLAGLAYDTANLAGYYHRPGAAPVEITLATVAVDGAHTDGGFVELQATNAKGGYRLDLPDAAIATGVAFVTVFLYGASDMAPCRVLIMLRPPVDSTATVLAYGLDHLLAASVAGSDIADDSIIALMASKGATADWDTFVNTTDSLEAIRDNATTPSITVGPLVASADAGERLVSPLLLEMHQSEDHTFEITVLDSDNAAVDISGYTLRFIVQDENNPPVAKFAIETGNISVSGAGNNVASVPVLAANSGTASLDWRWALRRVDSGYNTVLVYGPFKIHPMVTAGP